jgi:hypothetical protein
MAAFGLVTIVKEFVVQSSPKGFASVIVMLIMLSSVPD